MDPGYEEFLSYFKTVENGRDVFRHKELGKPLCPSCLNPEQYQWLPVNRTKSKDTFLETPTELEKGFCSPCITQKDKYESKIAQRDLEMQNNKKLRHVKAKRQQQSLQMKNIREIQVIDRSLNVLNRELGNIMRIKSLSTKAKADMMADIRRQISFMELQKDALMGTEKQSDVIFKSVSEIEKVIQVDHSVSAHQKLIALYDKVTQEGYSTHHILRPTVPRVTRPVNLNNNAAQHAAPLPGDVDNLAAPAANLAAPPVVNDAAPHTVPLHIVPIAPIAPIQPNYAFIPPTTRRGPPANLQRYTPALVTTITSAKNKVANGVRGDHQDDDDDGDYIEGEEYYSAVSDEEDDDDNISGDDLMDIDDKQDQIDDEFADWLRIGNLAPEDRTPKEQLFYDNYDGDLVKEYENTLDQ